MSEPVRLRTAQRLREAEGYLELGMADHALPLKTIGDAIAMRAHVMRQLEKADLADTPARCS